MEPKITIDEYGTPGTDLNFDYNKSLKDESVQSKISADKVKMKLNIQQIGLIKSMASMVTSGHDGKQYFFLPFWFKETDENNIYEVFHLDNLPEDLTKQLPGVR